MANVRVMGFSSPGKRRDQQDSYRYEVNETGCVAIVCDGMGGLNGGAIASRYAANRFMQDYTSRDETQELHAFLDEEIVCLDDAVFQLRSTDGKRLGGGTTIVSAIIRGEKMDWLAAGDSKLYIFRNNHLRCMTREHNYGMVLDEMLEERAISEESYEEEARKAEGLISFLGMGNIKVFDVNSKPFDVRNGDRFLLCSDGLYKTIPDEVIEEMLQEYNEDLPTAVSYMQQMIDENDIENQDNATLLLLAID